jgi:transcriptional regulator with XRE-family HTH domain
VANVKQTHKTEFGQFLASARAAAGLTQKGLAAELFVTESAVSKWERGLSYPDLSTLTPLSRALGVSEGELVMASEDHRGRMDAHTARTHRRWRAAITYTTLGAYVTTLAACAIVNISVDHTLSWFWVVASAVMLAFSVTTLPLLLTARRGWTTLVAAVLSLGILLASIQFFVGGTFFPIVAASVVFAVLVIWGPLALRAFGAPWMRRHAAVLCVLIDGAGLIALLWVILGAAGQLDALVSIALPLVAGGVTVALLVTLIIRYLPLRGLSRAAVACLVGAGVVLSAGPAVEALLERQPFAFASVQLGTWSDATVNGNVSALAAIGFVAAAALLVALDAVRGRRRLAPAGD